MGIDNEIHISVVIRISLSVTKPLYQCYMDLYLSVIFDYLFSFGHSPFQPIRSGTSCCEISSYGI